MTDKTFDLNGHKVRFAGDGMAVLSETGSLSAIAVKVMEFMIENDIATMAFDGNSVTRLT